MKTVIRKDGMSLAYEMYRLNLDNFNDAADELLSSTGYCGYRQDVKDWLKIHTLPKLATEFFHGEMDYRILIGKIATFLPDVLGECKAEVFPILADQRAVCFEKFL